MKRGITVKSIELKKDTLDEALAKKKIDRRQLAELLGITRTATYLWSKNGVTLMVKNALQNIFGKGFLK